MAADQIPLITKVQRRLGEILADGIDVHRCVAASALGATGQPGVGKLLQSALIDEDEDVRTDVMTALAELADPSTADAIMENFLGDPCPEVKLAAIRALVKLRHDAIIPHLLKLVVARDEDIVWDEDAFYDGGWDDWLDVQFEAITGLATLGVKAAVPEILKALDDDMGQDVTSVAIPALTKLGEPGLAALGKLLQDGDSRLRRRICEALQPNRSAAEDELFNNCLSDQELDVREVALNSLVQQNPDDTRVQDFFTDDEAVLRKIAIEAIGQKHPDVVVKCLRDPVPMVRRAAFRNIADHPEKYSKEGFSEIVIEAIGGNPLVAGDATVAWASLIGEPSAASLGKALENPSQPQVFRLGLIEALAVLGEPGFADLAKAAGDEDRQVRLNALTALGETAARLSWPNIAGDTLLAALSGDLVAPTEDEEAQSDAEDPAEETANVQPVASDDGAVDQTSQPPESTEAQAAQEDIEPAAAVSTLDQLVKHGLRTEAAEDPDYVEEVVELSEEDDRLIELSRHNRMRKKKISLDVKVAPYQDVRRFSARLFADLARPGVVEALVEALSVKDDPLTLSVLDSLASLGESIGKLDELVFQPVLSVLDDGESNARVLAIRCLGWVESDAVDVELTDLVDDDDAHVRQEVMRALGVRQIGHKILVDALKDDYSGVRITAARALAKSPDTEFSKQLVTLSLGYDGMHRSDVVAMIKQLGLSDAGELYLKVLADETSKRVWRVAIEALGELYSADGDDHVSLAA